jgi:hypothetical protein
VDGSRRAWKEREKWRTGNIGKCTAMELNSLYGVPMWGE